MLEQPIHNPLLFRRLSLLVFLIGVGTIPLAHSASPQDSVEKRLPQQTQARLVMKDAVLGAIKKHPMTSVNSAHRDVGAAYHSQGNALFAGDPSYNLSYNSDQLNSDRGYREFEGSLDFPIWIRGQKDARQTLGSSITSRADAELLLLSWEISGEVLERAWALHISQMEVEQAQLQQQSAQKLEADVKRRVEAGEIARGDLVLAQQNTAETDMSYQNAVAEVSKAQAAWQAYTGFAELPADLLNTNQNKTPAHDEHPHIIASQARLAAANANQEDIQKQRRDNSVLSLYAKRDRGIENAPYNSSLGVGISVPFGTKSSAAASVAKATTAVAVLRAEETEREREHELETTQAELAVKSASKTLGLVQQQNELAQKRWKLSKRSFELGESDLFQLIRARQQADIQARSLKRSQLELSLSKARLNHILGAMPL